jgi:hypothetical protein
MNINNRRSIFFAAFALFSLAIFALTPRPAMAQAPGETLRITVLDVPGGGTDALIESIEQLRGIEVKEQAWFLEQIKGRGFAAKGIMTRSDDLKWLMKGAEIDYILYLASGDKGDAAYEARLVGREVGKVVHRFPVDRTPNGLSQAGANGVVQQLQDYLKSQQPRDLEAEKRARLAAQKEAARQAQAHDPNEVKKKAASAKNAALAAFSKDWFIVTLRGIGLRRDLQVAGANQAVMSYTSAFYPGFALGIETFPIGMSNPDYADIGFYADYVQGFDSITIPDADNNEVSVSIKHLELEGGILYQLGDPLELKTSDAAKVDLTIGVRYSNFSADPNPALPSISHTSFVIGSRVTKEMFNGSFELRAGVNVTPIGIYGNGGALFGEESHTYGGGGNLGGMIAASDALGIIFGYEFRLQRTIYTGTGELEFTDASSFELVQGLSAGILYEY